MTQLSQLFRRGVVRPLDDKARDDLEELAICRAIRCEWLPIVGDDQFYVIWHSGLLQSIGEACNKRLSDYEDTIIPAERVALARGVVESFLEANTDNLYGFADCLKGLLTDASQTKMPVVFVL